jgi:hypothetical protein
MKKQVFIMLGMLLLITGKVIFAGNSSNLCGRMLLVHGKAF